MILHEVHHCAHHYNSSFFPFIVLLNSNLASVHSSSDSLLQNILLRFVSSFGSLFMYKMKVFYIIDNLMSNKSKTCWLSSRHYHQIFYISEQVAVQERTTVMALSSSY